MGSLRLHKQRCCYSLWQNSSPCCCGKTARQIHKQRISLQVCLNQNKRPAVRLMALLQSNCRLTVYAPFSQSMHHSHNPCSIPTRKLEYTSHHSFLFAQLSSLLLSPAPRLLQVEESESAPEASTTGKSSAGSSRFAYNLLTEDEAVKAPGVTRGKDGHVSLGNNDFFSNPMGGSASGKK